MCKEVHKRRQSTDAAWFPTVLDETRETNWFKVGDLCIWIYEQTNTHAIPCLTGYWNISKFISTYQHFIHCVITPRWQQYTWITLFCFWGSLKSFKFYYYLTRPIPEREYVEAYVKAYYLPESQLESWIREHKVSQSALLVLFRKSCSLLSSAIWKRLYNSNAFGKSFQEFNNKKLLSGVSFIRNG